MKFTIQEIKKMLALVPANLTVDDEQYSGIHILNERGVRVATFNHRKKKVNAAWFIASPFIVQQFLDYVDEKEAEFLDFMDNVPGFTDYYLRKHGYDPEQLGKDLAEVARRASENSPLNPKNKDKQL